MTSSLASQSKPAAAAKAGARAEWWRGAVIYQIYPRSYLDTNGDGVGDLNGVLQRLDYVASLGVDGVWLSPFFASPMRDFGYDVSDYRAVDPIFGSMDDFDQLIAKAKRLGLKVIIDQVYSHTSDQHAWFTESRADLTNPKADWYVWAAPKPDGSPPNNWQSVFGGPAWEFDSRREQYYLHNFLTSQPDLNLHNAEVQEAIIDVARFWLDRGVDGFRLDALNFSMHDPLLRDNPPAPRDGRKISRPFDMQRHVHNLSHPEMPRFLERFRKALGEYPDVFTVAEIGGEAPLGVMKAYTEGEEHLNSAYGFDFLYEDRITPQFVRETLSAWGGGPGEGWPSWAFSNHDAPRAVSRWAAADAPSHAALVYALLLMCLRGNVFLYQGEELGLPQADVPYEALKDPEAIANWPQTLGRDGARTPMPWTTMGANAGFSSAAPWLPVDPRHQALAVDRQERDPASSLNRVRRFVELRKSSETLRLGAMRFLEAPDGVLCFLRSRPGHETLCVFNLSEANVNWTPNEAIELDANEYAVFEAVGFDQDVSAPPAELPAYSGYVAERR